MRVVLLGVHNAESASERLSGVLVDEALTLDAGGLTRSLSRDEQAGVRHVFVTHRHYDHLRDIPALAHSTPDAGTLHVYGLPDTLDALTRHLINGVIYPPYHQRMRPDGTPRLALHAVEIGAPVDVDGRRVTAFPAFHTCPAVGYLVEDGPRSIFYTGDTSAGFAACLPDRSISHLLAEVTFATVAADRATENGHLTPETLRGELAGWVRLGREPPPVTVVHMNPTHQRGIEQELAALAAETGWRIEPGRAGMVLEV